MLYNMYLRVFTCPVSESCIWFLNAGWEMATTRREAALFS